MIIVLFFFEGYADHRDLHVLTHSFPTRRSSDLAARAARRRTGGGCVADPRARRRARPRFGLRSARLHDGGTLDGRAAGRPEAGARRARRSEEPTSELQSLMRISYAVCCLKKKPHNS